MNFKKHTIKLLKPYLSFIRSLIAKFNYNISPINNLCWGDKYALLKDIDVKVIIDVGANKGNISRKYKKMFPAARVISIKPIKDLCENIKNNFDWAEVYNVAICDICSRKVFNINSSRDTSSLLETDLNSIPESYINLQNVVDKINVDGITLDKLTSDLEIEKINILKLDIQGGELNALKGARRLLENNKIDLIFDSQVLLIIMMFSVAICLSFNQWLETILIMKGNERYIAIVNTILIVLIIPSIFLFVKGINQLLIIISIISSLRFLLYLARFKSIISQN